MSNDLFALICEYLASTLNYGIVALALVEFWYFLRAVISLKTLKKDVMHLEEKKEKKIFGKQGRKRAEEEGTYIREWNYEKYDLVMKHYPKTESKYTRFNQVIQLFPLLGILGTVAGLYESVDGISSGDISGVSFALSSTVLGIIFAIIFKILDTYLITKYVNSIDHEMERFEQNWNNRRMNEE